MTPDQLKKLDRELGAFLEQMTTGMGRPERRSAMRNYLTGLLLDGERKSVQPMAARLVSDAAESDALRQRLQDCVSLSPWSGEEMLRRLALKFDHEMPGIEAFVTDDTGFAKKGNYSVGVARQYSGTLGRTDNCQVAVSLHLAGAKGSGCIAMRLYLPEEEWGSDKKRRAAAGVPEDVPFRRKWEIALEQLDAALAAGIRRHIMLADAGYGDSTEFRTGIEERGLSYVGRFWCSDDLATGCHSSCTEHSHGRATFDTPEGKAIPSFFERLRSRPQCHAVSHRELARR